MMNERRFRMILLSSAAVLLPVGAAMGQTTLPKGGAFVAGAGTIGQSGTAMTIDQTTARGVIDWKSFSIGQGGSVTINNGSGATLNRVTGGELSTILGTLKATGTLYLINPQGVVVGATGTVVAGGDFVASTHDVANEHFMRGGTLLFTGDSSGTVRNLGKISSTGGDVILIAREVTNAGTIQAPRGTVGLAGGQEVLLTEGGKDGERVFVRVGPGRVDNQGTVEAAQAELKAAGGNVYALAGNNGGVVRATGTEIRQGRIWLTAPSGDVTNAGTLEARNADGSGGWVTVAAERGTATHQGAIDVRGAGPARDGGTAVVTGERVTLIGRSRIDASGTGKGGTVLAGGDWQGGRDPAKKIVPPPIPAAKRLAMQSGATISADGGIAGGKGDGGAVVLWSDEETRFAGTVSARGGAAGGDGGRVETSGRDALRATGTVDAQAPAGKGGQWLLDPRNVTITAGGLDATAGGTVTPTADDATVDAATLNAALNGGTSVTITTGTTGSQSGDITVSGAIAKTAGGDATLRLNADRSINVLQSITSTEGRLDVVLNADRNADGQGNIIVGTRATATEIRTNGGSIEMAGGDTVDGNGWLTGAARGLDNGTTQTASGVFLENAWLHSGGGDIRLRGTGASGNPASDSVGVMVQGGSVVDSGTGTITVTGIGPSNGTTGNMGVNIRALALGSGVTSAPSTVTSASTAAQAIVITGTGAPAGTAGNSSGVSVQSGSIVEATGDGGGITITGTGGVGTDRYNDGIIFANGAARVRATSGAVLLSGTKGPNASALDIEFIGAGYIIGGGRGASPMGSGTITLETDSLVLGTTTLQTTGAVTLRPRTAGRAIDVGSGTDAAAALEISTAEIANITAGTLRIGRDDAGNAAGAITVSAPVSVGTASTLSLFTGSTVAQSGSGAITATNLRVSAGGAVSLAANTNAVTRTAIRSGGNNAVAFRDDTGFEIGSVDGADGVGAGTASVTLTSSGAVTQSQPVSAGGLALKGAGGGYTLEHASNSFGSLAADTGSLSVKTTGDLTVGTVGTTAGLQATGAVRADAGGSITLGNAVGSSATGNAVTLVAGSNFINNAGNSALAASNGRWLVYSTSPTGNAGEPTTHAWRRYNATISGLAPADVTDSGNGYLYGTAPSLALTVTGTFSKTYDGTTTITGTGLGVTGATGTINGDTVGASLSSTTADGSVTGKGVGSGKTISIAATDIGTPGVTDGTGKPVYGYAIGSVTVNSTGTITAKSLTPSLTGTVSKTYDGTTTATLDASNVTLTGVVGTDTVSATATNAGYDSKGAGTGKTVTATGLALAGTDAGNYTLSTTTAGAAVGTITAATLAVTAQPAGKTEGSADPPLTYILGGLQTGDTAGAVLSGALVRAAGETPGVYAIGQGTLAANGDYTIAFTGAAFTVATAPPPPPPTATPPVPPPAEPPVTPPVTPPAEPPTEPPVTPPVEPPPLPPVTPPVPPPPATPPVVVVPPIVPPVVQPPVVGGTATTGTAAAVTTVAATSGMAVGGSASFVTPDGGTGVPAGLVLPAAGGATMTVQLPAAGGGGASGSPAPGSQLEASLSAGAFNVVYSQPASFTLSAPLPSGGAAIAGAGGPGGGAGAVLTGSSSFTTFKPEERPSVTLVDKDESAAPGVGTAGTPGRRGEGP